MLKNSYASGFLFHAPSQQILLQKLDPSSEQSRWSLIGTDCIGNEEVVEQFKELVKKILNINLSTNKIHVVYDYFHENLKKKHIVSYAEVDSLGEYSESGETDFAWFSMKEISKLNLTPETKQDIIVGQRVIDSQVRKNSGQQTIG